MDYLAVSFPRSAADMQEARALLGDEGKEIGLVAKLSVPRLLPTTKL